MSTTETHRVDVTAGGIRQSTADRKGQRMTYTLHTVGVDGGDLRVGAWGDADAPLVVAVHGITSSHLAFALVAQDLAADHHVVAPDLRGRGGSRDLPAPYGMPAHADDVAAVIRAFGPGPAVVLGHSMGAFVALELVRRHPELVSALVLVDGGPPLPPPDGLDPSGAPEDTERAITEAIGPAFTRLTQTFHSRAAYREMWRAHPSFRDWNDAMAAYVDYDLVGEEPTLKPACRLEAAVTDGAQVYALPGARPQDVGVPAVFLRAERGMFDEPEPFYRPGYAGRWLPGVEERTVEDVNHYTISLSPHGAAAVASAVRQVSTRRA